MCIQVDHFNDDESDARLFLISTRAGNLGVNLTAATRVVLFDSSWNPSNDAQAIFRAWRYGQTKPVYVYRLLGAGTVEEKIYARQITKASMTSGVCDDEQLVRTFTQAELDDLWSLSDEPAMPTERELSEPQTRFDAIDEGCVDVTLMKLLKSKETGAYAAHGRAQTLD